MSLREARPAHGAAAEERVTHWIEDLPDVALVSTHANGKSAADAAASVAPDVVLLDVEMPQMDGLTALPLILERSPASRVLIVSTLTKRGARVSIEALTRGAADYIAKPGTLQENSAAAFRDELIAKVRLLGSALAARRARGKGFSFPADAAAPRLAGLQSKPTGWRLSPAIRDMVDWRRLNLLEPLGLAAAPDIVFCRNVLIYFDTPTKAGVLDRIARVMAPDGFLMLGGSETIVGLTQSFEISQGSRQAYRPARRRLAA